MASDWQSQRQLFQNRLNVLNSTTPSVDVLVFNAKNNPIKDNIDALRARLANYNILQNDIIQYVASNSNNLDISSIVTSISLTQRKLNKLIDSNKEKDLEVETAIARDELLRSRNTKRNAHTLFLMDRPLKKQMIPILWLMSVLFIGVALIIIKDSLPIMNPLQTGATVLSGTLAFITNKIVLYILLFCGFCVSVYLSLKIAGVL